MKNANGIRANNASTKKPPLLYEIYDSYLPYHLFKNLMNASPLNITEDRK